MLFAAVTMAKETFFFITENAKAKMDNALLNQT